MIINRLLLGSIPRTSRYLTQIQIISLYNLTLTLLTACTPAYFEATSPIGATVYAHMLGHLDGRPLSKSDLTVFRLINGGIAIA